MQKNISKFHKLSYDNLYQILEYLLVIDGALISRSNKEIYNVWKFVEKNRWNILEKKHPISNFIKNYIGIEVSYSFAIYHFFEYQNQEVLLMGGQNGSLFTEKVDKMIIKKNGTICFTDSIPMLGAFINNSTIYNKGEIISIGTKKYIDESESIEIFDTLQQKRTLLKIKSPENFYRSTIAIFDDKIFIIGGVRYNNGIPIFSKLIHELNGDSRETLQARSTKLIIGRYYASSIEFHDKLYICGGVAEHNRLNSVEVFNPLDGAIEIDGNMIKSRINFSLFIYDNEIYAVAGDMAGCDITIEKRDNFTKQWKIITILKGCRYGCGSTIIDSKIFLFGGTNSRGIGGKNKKITYDFYDIKTNLWVSQDGDSLYFDESSRMLPREMFNSKAVLCTNLYVK
jgi:hypothetical protein